MPLPLPLPVPVPLPDAAIGVGPAREACLAGLRGFLEGLDAGPDAPVPTDGFAAEGLGAALALAGRDPPALDGPLGVLVHIGHGVGLAIAGARGEVRRPTARWTANGWAFGRTLLRPDAALARGHGDLAPELVGPADEGLGRALWYLAAGDPARIARLARGRTSDVWAGVGQASAFTGGLGPDGLSDLERRAGHCAEAYRAGRVLAASARVAVLDACITVHGEYTKRE